MNAEWQLANIRAKVMEDPRGYEAQLLAMVEERDGLIHDLQLDGSALARRAVEEFASGLVEWIRSKAKECQANARADKYWAGEIMGLNLVAVHLLDHSPTPDPLPPDQARAEAERLRQQIDELLSGCGSHSCKVQRPHGQGVNGPCRCVEKLRAARGEEYTP